MITFYDEIQKATGVRQYPRAIRRLRKFLDKAQPKLAYFFARTWTEQQNAISYAELREAILAGSISTDILERWRQDYSKLIDQQLKPAWIQAMQTAAQELIERYPDILFDPNSPAIREWTEQRAAELVTKITDAQRAALNALVQRAAVVQDISVDQLAVAIRPTVGLYPQQAAANLRYFQNLRRNGVPEKSAQKLALKYAERQQRYRAMNIARTELAFAYNAGEFVSVKQAVDDGLMGKTQKRWLSALDERVCDVCRALDGKQIDLNAEFMPLLKMPPAHPSCRCVLQYIETEPPDWY